MAWTVADLFAIGAQNTVLSLLQRGEASFGDIVSALERRFGTIPPESSMAIAELREQVVNAVTAAESIPLLEKPIPADYGLNPNLPQQYRYTVLARLQDPLQPGQYIEVPWTIDSKDPLSFSDILAEAEQELNQNYRRADSLGGAQHADLHRRDIAFRRTVDEQYGGNAPIEFEILGAYRRA